VQPAGRRRCPIVERTADVGIGIGELLRFAIVKGMGCVLRAGRCPEPTHDDAPQIQDFRLASDARRLPIGNSYILQGGVQ
jgi:hypothetical protein